MLLALGQNHNPIVRIGDNLAATFAAANSSANLELVGLGQIVSSVGHNETMASSPAVKQNLQLGEAARFEVLGKSLAFVDLADFDLLLAPLTRCQLTVESFWTRL